MVEVLWFFPFAAAVDTSCGHSAVKMLREETELEMLVDSEQMTPYPDLDIQSSIQPAHLYTKSHNIEARDDPINRVKTIMVKEEEGKHITC